MNRREFIKTVGIGAATLMIDGQILGEARRKNTIKISAVKRGFACRLEMPALQTGEDKFQSRLS